MRRESREYVSINGIGWMGKWEGKEKKREEGCKGGDDRERQVKRREEMRREGTKGVRIEEEGVKKREGGGEKRGERREEERREGVKCNVRKRQRTRRIRETRKQKGDTQKEAK